MAYTLSKLLDHTATHQGCHLYSANKHLAAYSMNGLGSALAPTHRLHSTAQTRPTPTAIFALAPGGSVGGALAAHTTGLGAKKTTERR